MKKIALIVHSKHTNFYAKKVAKEYSNVRFLEVKRTPTHDTRKIERRVNEIVIGIGGGSVIDTAKILARPNRCIAIPTTASGACATPYATVWGKKKESIKTAKPILKMKYDIDINLPDIIKLSTFSDALSHALESLWSKKATILSKYYSFRALWYLKRFLNNNNIYTLVKGGNFAGNAIAIAKTNIVHAISYPLTIHYGMNHGLACGLILPYIFDRNFMFISNFCAVHIDNLKEIDSELIANEALKYNKINDSIKSINKSIIINVLEKIKNV